MAFLTGQSWRALKYWYTAGEGGGVGAEQGFRRLFVSQTELTRDLVSSMAQAKCDKILVDRDRKGPV